MKKINLTAILALIFSVATFAQSNNEEVELYQSVFGMGKKAIVTEFMSVEGETATNFWALYDEYETARKQHGQKRIVLLNNYVNGYTTLDDEKTQQVIKEMISLGKEYDKLIVKYYKKINKTCGAKVGGQFFQLESYFQSIVRLTLMEEIPFIGEFDK